MRFQQLDNGQVRRGSAIGDQGTFQDQPAVSAVRPDELPDKPRLPHAGLAHHCDGLPVPGGGALQGLSQLLQLTSAPDEAGQAARSAACSRDRARPSPSSSYTGVAVSSPFTVTGPSGRT
jgi:hypothetical protein